MTISVHQGFSLSTNIYVEKWKKDGPVESLEFENLVLDVGYANLLSNWPGIRVPNYLYFGTGTTEPAPDQLGLQSISPTLPGKFRTSQTGVLGIDNRPFEVVHRTEMQFDYGEGDAEGTWTELGLAFGATYTEPYNRALFRDINGDPIAITVLSDEFLRLFIEIRFHFSGAVKTGTFNVNGVPREFTAAMNASFICASGNCACNIWQSGWPTNFKRPGGGAIPFTGLTKSYDPANLSVSVSYSHLTHSEFEVGAPLSFGSYGAEANSSGHGSRTCFAISFPTVTKLAGERISGSWYVQWGRVKPWDYTGTASAGGASTITDSTKTFTVDELIGKEIIILSETGQGQSRTVTSNTATEITVGVAWDIVPDATTKYGVRDV